MRVTLSWSNWNLEMLFILSDGGQPENLEKNPRSKARITKKTNPHMEPSGNQTCPGHIINARRALSPPRHTELLIYLKYLCHKLVWLGRPIVHLLGTFYWTGHSVCNHYDSCRYKPGQKSFRIRSSRPELGLRLILEAKLGSWCLKQQKANNVSR